MLGFKEFIVENDNKSLDDLVNSRMNSDHNIALLHPDITNEHIGKILKNSMNNDTIRRAVTHPMASKEQISDYLDTFKHPYYHNKHMHFADIAAHENAPKDHPVLVKSENERKEKEGLFKKDQEEAIKKNKESYDKAMKAWNKLSPEEKEKIHGDFIQKNYGGQF